MKLYNYLIMSFMDRWDVPACGKVLLSEFNEYLRELPSALELREVKRATFYHALKELHRRGFVEVDARPGVPPRKYYSLTPLGRRFILTIRSLGTGETAAGQVVGGVGRPNGARHANAPASVRVSPETLASLTSRLGAEIKAVLSEWYEAGVNGEERVVSKPIYRGYARQLVEIVRRALGIEVRDRLPLDPGGPGRGPPNRGVKGTRRDGPYLYE
ncbi:MAG: winged helix-turn-helix transcriptional regulator [Promethearchaeota archaeon]